MEARAAQLQAAIAESAAAASASAGAGGSAAARELESRIGQLTDALIAAQARFSLFFSFFFFFPALLAVGGRASCRPSTTAMYEIIFTMMVLCFFLCFAPRMHLEAALAASY